MCKLFSQIIELALSEVVSKVDKMWIVQHKKKEWQKE
jgi:hypothetical protein